MKYSIPFYILIIALVSGCNACIETRQPDSLYQHKEIFTIQEQTEKTLIEHITKRTVRVIIQCTIYDIKTKKVHKKIQDGMWGTGAIIYSSDKYSLIQTAAHVVINKNTTKGNLIRKCSGFKFERRDTNNKVVDIVKPKMKVIAIDKKFDIAMILVYHNFGVQSRIAKKTYLGQSIRIVGYPSLRQVKGRHLSYEKGYIATKNMGIEVRYGTAGYFGISGGAVWNQQGEVVGTVVSLGGFRTLLGHYIPLQNHLYGPGIKTLRAYYLKHKLTYLLRR